MNGANEPGVVRLGPATIRDVDTDPEETREWLDAMAGVVRQAGDARGRYLLKRLVQQAQQLGVVSDVRPFSAYRNSISWERQAPFPGDLELEERITSINRWNALAMVVRANRSYGELGGHIASYASAAEIFEVGFNHFFRVDDSGYADLVYFQAHSAPGVYARAFLERRISEEQLANYRREVGGTGLCSYPHPWLMPDFWQVPTGSMGLGPISAIYQARFMRYLSNRGIARLAGRRVWGVFGDGEMDEPESIGALTLASREKLDNLTFVINCNLQRLDGPVRGNGQIVQELESLFAGAGWNVIKVLWGSEWDPLFARDAGDVLLRRFASMVDGEFQTLGANDGAYNQQHFFDTEPELQTLVENMTPLEIDGLKRGGHDLRKLYAAFAAAAAHKGEPTVILAKTKKGYGVSVAESRMTAHQQKKLGVDELRAIRDRLQLPLSDDDVDSLRFYRPSDASAEMRYLADRRRRLGGALPARKSGAAAVEVPARAEYARFALQAGGKAMSTTMAAVRLLTALLKDKVLGPRIVPIVADEARTFGMDGLFRQIGIYSPAGQLYEPQDARSMLYYRESSDGQLLEEGITEAGALASWTAAATSYSVHGVAMLPLYIFYSMFGFQRVGDLIWAAADQRSRGFLIGATAGRTSLGGEGLQHQDGSSHVVAATVPNCRAYDPAFACELAVIFDHGAREMLERQADVFYYITVMNESYEQPSLPPNVDEDIIKGMYRLRAYDGNAAGVAGVAGGAHGADGTVADAATVTDGGFAGNGGDGAKTTRVRLLGSGAILREAIAAADMLAADWGIASEVYSVTSFAELARDAREVERRNRLGPLSPQRESHVQTMLAGDVPIVAATDYVRAYPGLIAPYLRARYITLGTDGFGRSDTRAALRAFFEVDRHHIAVAALSALAQEQLLSNETVAAAVKRYGLNGAATSPWLV